LPHTTYILSDFFRFCNHFFQKKCDSDHVPAIYIDKAKNTMINFLKIGKNPHKKAIVSTVERSKKEEK